jgi:hypothetical protein
LQSIDALAAQETRAPLAPPPPPAAPERNISRPTLVAIALIVIGSALIGGLVVAARSSSAPTSPAAVVSVAPTTTTACPSLNSFIDVIASYERQARWGLAASTAQTALRTPGLCAPDRAAMGQNLVALSQQALFEQPPAPEDAPGQRRVATAYADLKTLANQYGVQPPPPLPIARSAYDNRLFLLATFAYADAFANGDSSTEDREVVRADYAAQYNLGLIWSQRADATQHQEGLARLATACRIDERNQLGSQEACNKLQILLGPRNRWPPPLADPLIDTLPPATPAHGY